MHLKEYFKEKIHNAILIEGDKSELLPQILDVLEENNFSILNNPDFFHLSIDVLKIKDAKKLKEIMAVKGFSTENTKMKRVFILSTNSLLLDSQNTLLKVFEEMNTNNHFFLLMPSIDGLLETFVSRFYVVRFKEFEQNEKEISDFLKMNLNDRFLFLKKFLKNENEDEDEELEENQTKEELVESSHTKALKFLNSLEFFLYHKVYNKKISKKEEDLFKHIFKVRKYLRQPGSASKTLLESVAILLP